MKVHFGSAGIEKVIPFKYKGKQYYLEMHCFCGPMVSDKNRMGIFTDHPAYIYAMNMLDAKKEFKN
jgi:hypothetical protein